MHEQKFPDADLDGHTNADPCTAAGEQDTATQSEGPAEIFNDPDTTTLLVLWDERFHSKCALGHYTQQQIDEAVSRRLVHAQKINGHWYYAVEGLNRHFPLPEGRGWQDPYNE